MSHCDYDIIFYRVFCGTVLGIAFTFTVILTNVFIDIDGLLSKKVVETNPASDVDSSKTEDIKNEIQYDDLNYETDLYRGKRSIEPENFLFEVKNPNVKKILTNKLATLLEEMDEEESTKKSVAEARRHINTDIKQDNDVETENDNMLHLAMHNILLQGIIGHMDLNNVYKKVHKLIKNFYEHNNSENSQSMTASSKETMKEYPKKNEEQKFLEELLKCKTLKDQINEVKNNTHFNIQKEPKVIIKTIIEINEKGKLQRENNSNTNDVVGLIKLIYNGKSIKFAKLEDTDNKQSIGQNIISGIDWKTNKNTNTNQIQVTKENKVSNTNWNKVIENYLKQYPMGKNENYLEDNYSKINRQKRQIKIHYLDKNFVTEKPKSTQKLKKDDEELYIEIETHFDGKGIKGEKKKKLVRNLINKIQRAIHDDSEAEPPKKSMFGHIKVKKRNQDPIKSKNDFFLNNIVPVIRSIEHRQLNPISKLPKENVMNNYDAPIWYEKLLSIKSDEMDSPISDSTNSDIPKREQKPIIIEKAEMLKGLKSRVDDLNNTTLFLKDIDGSGFTIGFNQYVDEPPDTSSLKLFSGVENLIQEYHKTYDDLNKYPNIEIEQEKYSTRDQQSIATSHDISRRSVNDYNRNRYKILLKNILNPLNSNKPRKEVGKKIYRHKISNNHQSTSGDLNIISKPIKINDLSIAFINNYYKEPGGDNRQSLDNSSKRRKRSLKVKKIINPLSKTIKLNRYINTKIKFNTKVFKTKRRNKRQVNKIRIIARERSQKNSNEGNVILLSPNNLFTNKALKDLQTGTDADAGDAQNADTIPFSEFLNINYPTQPIVDEYPNEGETLSLPKYPHVFFEEQKSRDYSREDSAPKPYRIQAKSNIEKSTDITEEPAYSNVKLPSIEEIMNAILPPKSNYKVTVKISPKNTSDINSGFKEVHTSVNKSYDRNGIRYFSLLNVSQLSKVENVNESKYVPPIIRSLPSPPIIKELKEKEKQIETLFQYHKKRIDSQLDILRKERLFLVNVLNKNAKEKVNNENNESLKEADSLINLVKEIENSSTIIPKLINNVTERLKTTEKIRSYETKMSQRNDNISNRKNDDSKLNIYIDSIKNNEQSAKEILKKIDINTSLLRQFLHKLSETQTKAPTTERIVRVENINSYNQNLFQRNNSRHSPFTYGISPINPMVDSRKSSTPRPLNFPIRENQSRFFIDDLEEYNSVSATIRINTTHV